MKKRHWFNFIEDFSLLGLGAGLSLSFISKQLLYTSAPLSFALLVGILNRRRIEQAQDQRLSDSLATLDQRLSANLEVLEQKIQTMPTPEMIGDVRQSILRHSREKMQKTYAYIHKIKQDVENRFKALDEYKIGEAREEITQLQLQYVEVYNSLSSIAASLPQFVTNERTQELEQAIANISTDTSKIDATVKTLNEYSSHTLTNLQDQVTQLNRQIKSLPPQADTSSIKREVGELVRVVADLVPKRDLNALVADLRVIQQQQTSQLQTEDALRRDMQKINNRLQALPDVPQLRSQLEESFTREIRAINRQLRTLYHSPELKSTIEDVLRGEVQHLQEMIADRSPSLPYDLVFDLSSDPNSSADPITPGSRQALTDALESTQQRLILIWPWSVHTELDADMLRRIEGFLKQQRQLDIGWCHVSDRQDDRFLSIINRRWSINPLSTGSLQGTLKRLLAIKRYYPNNFQFKILGTAENYLISDDEYAILGLDARLKTQTSLKDAELKLRTTDEQIVKHLTQRFDEPNPPAHDVDAYWNRAITRYDLGDKAGAASDIDVILAANPDNSAAYNLRGIIHYEQKNLEASLADFTQSIALNPEQCSAYCNRGYLQSEQEDQYGAIADFSLAIQSAPTSAIAYFYRGAASQKLEDYEGAIADYTEALVHSPNTPAVFYQRAMVYQTIGNYQLAIADLEQATEHFEEQKSPINAQKAQETLLKVEQLANEMPSATPFAAPSVESSMLVTDSSLSVSSTSAQVDLHESTDDTEREYEYDSLDAYRASVDDGNENGLYRNNLEAQAAAPLSVNPASPDLAEANYSESDNPGQIIEHPPEDLTIGEDSEEFVSFDVDETVRFSGQLEDASVHASPHEFGSPENSDGLDAYADFDVDEGATTPFGSQESEIFDVAASDGAPWSEANAEQIDSEPSESAFDEPAWLDTVVDEAGASYLETLDTESIDAPNTEPYIEPFRELELSDNVELSSNLDFYDADGDDNIADHSVDSIVWDGDGLNETEASAHPSHPWVSSSDDASDRDEHSEYIDPESTYVQKETDEWPHEDDAAADVDRHSDTIDPESTYVQKETDEWPYRDDAAADVDHRSDTTDSESTDVDEEANEWPYGADDASGGDRYFDTEEIYVDLEETDIDLEEPYIDPEETYIDPEETYIRAARLPSDSDHSSGVSDHSVDSIVWEANDSEESDGESDAGPNPGDELVDQFERWGDFFDGFGAEDSTSQTQEEANAIAETATNDGVEQEDIDVQQIGTQTLEDFFSVINSDIELNNTDLFANNDAWNDPRQNGISAQSSPMMSESNRPPSAENGDRNATGSDPSIQQRDDSFLRFSGEDIRDPWSQNGNRLSTSETPQTYADELPNDASDENVPSDIDAESLADFCRRFTI
ncbi:MAG: tetratricopeptide repeat protein [Cyanobacteria bacterium J06633_2]